MRSILIVLTAGALLGFAWVHHLVQPIFDGDPTGIVWVVAAVTGAGALAAFWAPSWLAWLCEHGVTLMLGLLGTVVGFMSAIAGAVSGDDAAKMDGVTTALTTTIAGMVSHLFLIVLEKVSRR